MSTWWRQARDRDGKTIVKRLEQIDSNCLTHMHKCGVDETGNALYLAISHHRKRIRSIIRRIKRCSRCRALGIDFLQAERISIVMCEVCGGTGKVSFDTKEKSKNEKDG